MAASDVVPDIDASRKPGAPAVVGIGASAGGLAALRTFFSHVPQESGLAWVVVVHHPPDQPGHLAEVLQQHVRMPVQQVTRTTQLQADCVYVIPPNGNLSAIDTHLRLAELEEQRREHPPIDHFFRTLALTHDGHSVGVILTGTGSDGALGLKAVREKGGLTVVQDPREAEYDGMPQSAIATGLVDLVLRLEQIPGAVLGYVRTEARVPIADAEDLQGGQREQLQKVFAQLRARTGRDFQAYRRSAILRRIQRRMQMRQVEELAEYLDLLRMEPGEVRALADDLVIRVSSFFRDPDVFDALAKQVVPRLLEGREEGDTIRVWSVGCATGEEAYSLAMLLLEAAERRPAPPRIHVFASDLHQRSLELARHGFYPGDIGADVSAERLKRFFRREDGGYRVRREVRERVTFAPHDLLTHPPVSRVDLIACRNVLVNLDHAMHAPLLAAFHHALRPGAWLVLGTSESLQDPELFHLESSEHHLYRRRDVPCRPPRLPLPGGVRIPEEDAGRSNATYGPTAAGPLHVHLQLPGEDAAAGVLATPDSREELQTAREELQTASEELQTASEENRLKVEELAQLATDLNNLLASTGIATLFLDREMRIRRFTPGAAELFNVRPDDRGRPLGDLTNRVGYTEIAQDAEQVLATLAPVKREVVAGENGRWYLTNVLPYRSSEDRIDGVVITFVDITERKRAERALRASEERHRLIVESALDYAIFTLDPAGRIETWSPGAEAVFGWRAAEVIGRSPHFTYTAEDRAAGTLEAELRSAAADGFALNVRWHLRRDGTPVFIDGVVRAVPDPETGALRGFLKIGQNRTERRQIEDALHELNQTLEQRVAARTAELERESAARREVLRRLVTAEEEQRKQISRELHDRMGQHLTGLLLGLRSAQSDSASPRLNERLRELERLAGETARDVQNMAVELRPPALDALGLVAALESHLEEWSGRHGMQHDFHARGFGDIRLSREVEITLYRVVQEGLTNILKHAAATHVDLILERREDVVRLLLEDNGAGFDVERVLASAARASRLGVRGMLERVALLDGELEIESSPGHGTTLYVRVPAVEGNA